MLLRIPKKEISKSGKDPRIQINKPRISNRVHNSNKKLNLTKPTPKKPSQNRTLIRNIISDDDDTDNNNNDNDNDSCIDRIGGKRLRGENSTTDNIMEPLAKKRRINNIENNSEYNGKCVIRKKKRKSKGPKLRFCVVCAERLHDDNKGKYCGELCKKEASDKRKAERILEKKEKEKEIQAQKEKENTHEIRKRTQLKFSEIFCNDSKAGNNLEKRIYKLCSNNINDKYHQKIRTLAFNLNENKVLLNSVLRGELTLKQLSLMNNEQLAPQILVEERKCKQEKFNVENTLQNPMVFGKPMDTHFAVENTNDKYTETNDNDIDIIPMNITNDIITNNNNNNNNTKNNKTTTPFDANEMTVLLKNCKSITNTNIYSNDEPLQIHRDESTDEEEEEEDTLEPPPQPPPMNMNYYRKNNTRNNTHNNNKNNKNIWNGYIRTSSNEKPFDLSFIFIGGKDTKLKTVIPKYIQINGRTKFKDISNCLHDLVKVTKNKFTIILGGKCKNEKYKKEYKNIIKQCRESNKGFMIDMKSKAKIKIILLPSFKNCDKNIFDINQLEKLWKCSLPKTDDLWALLTVYNKDTNKTEREKEKEKEKDRKRERNRSRDRDRHRHTRHKNNYEKRTNPK